MRQRATERRGDPDDTSATSERSVWRGQLLNWVHKITPYRGGGALSHPAGTVMPVILSDNVPFGTLWAPRQLFRKGVKKYDNESGR